MGLRVQNRYLRCAVVAHHVVLRMPTRSAVEGADTTRADIVATRTGFFTLVTKRPGFLHLGKHAPSTRSP